jgi:hypothetical protein
MGPSRCFRLLPRYSVRRIPAAPLGSVARKWAEQQSDLCAYFAAAALDRRITAVVAR